MLSHCIAQKFIFGCLFRTLILVELHRELLYACDVHPSSLIIRVETLPIYAAPLLPLLPTLARGTENQGAFDAKHFLIVSMILDISFI
jgi:hypothetical protein